MSDEGNEQPPTNEGQSGEQNQELPDWARAKISEANAEAAKYRTEKRDAVEAAKQEVSESFQEKATEYESQLEQANSAVEAERLENMKLTAAVKALAPSQKVHDFAELLKGEDEESLGSHAEKLMELFDTADQSKEKKQKAHDRSQGHGNNQTIPLNGDKLLGAVMGKIK